MKYDETQLTFPTIIYIEQLFGCSLISGNFTNYMNYVSKSLITRVYIDQFLYLSDVVFEEYKPYEVSLSPEKKTHTRNATNSDSSRLTAESNHHSNSGKSHEDDLIFEDDITTNNKKYTNDADTKTSKKGYLHSLKSRLTRPRKANDTDMFLSGINLDTFACCAVFIPSTFNI